MVTLFFIMLTETYSHDLSVESYTIASLVKNEGVIHKIGEVPKEIEGKLEIQERVEEFNRLAQRLL